MRPGPHPNRLLSGELKEEGRQVDPQKQIIILIIGFD